MAVFDCAVWRPVANHGGRMAAQLGLILHHAVATGSLYTWFNNPSSGVSATFWVGLDGTVEQYVDSELTAWHAMQMNDSYCGVETEGCSAPPHDQPMTDAMVDALAAIYAEGHRRHGWPNRLAEADGQAGFGFHRMAVATSCPCDVRLRRRADILARAFAAAPDPTPTPPPLEVPDMIAPPCTFVMNRDHQQAFYVDAGGSLRHHYQPGPGKAWVAENLGGGWDPDSGLAHAVGPGDVDQVWGVRADGRRAQCYWSGRAWVTQSL